MGWLWLFVIGAGASLLLWRLGVGRSMWMIVGAALMLGAIGYTLQGRPLLAGRPTRPDSRPIEIDPGLIALRNRMWGSFTAEAAYLSAADSMLRIGARDSAARVVIGGIRKYREDAELWTGLGDVLALHDGGVVSPAALFAFRHAMNLAPKHPAPPFFLGLAYVRAGQFDVARPFWARALALTPEGADYKPEIAVRLALLDQYLSMASDGDVGP